MPIGSTRFERNADRVGYFQHYGALHSSWESPVGADRENTVRTLTGWGTLNTTERCTRPGNPVDDDRQRTGMGTLNTTERCTRPGNPPLVPIGSTGMGTFNTTERCTRPGNLGADRQHRLGYFQHYGALYSSWESPV